MSNYPKPNEVYTDLEGKKEPKFDILFNAIRKDNITVLHHSPISSIEIIVEGEYDDESAFFEYSEFETLQQILSEIKL